MPRSKPTVVKGGDLAAGHHYDFRIILLGSSGVGKTSIFQRYVTEEFCKKTKPSIGLDNRMVKLEICEARVMLFIWDTAGQDRFRSLPPNFYRSAQAAIVVFDVCSAASFAEVEGWVEELRHHSSEDSEGLLVGNKSDVAETKSARQVEQAEARSLASRLGMNYITE